MSDTHTNSSYTSSLGSAHRFWTIKHVATNSIFLILAGIAAYLQYYLYPLVMSRPIGSTSFLSFGETDISLKVSFLTFQYTATRCLGTDCVRLEGINSFDFFQLIMIILVILNLLHFFSLRKANLS